jgi:hypothetical protein
LLTILPTLTQYHFDQVRSKNMGILWFAFLGAWNNVVHQELPIFEKKDAETHETEKTCWTSWLANMPTKHTQSSSVLYVSN